MKRGLLRGLVVYSKIVFVLIVIVSSLEALMVLLTPGLNPGFALAFGFVVSLCAYGFYRAVKYFCEAMMKPEPPTHAYQASSGVAERDPD